MVKRELEPKQILLSDDQIHELFDFVQRKRVRYRDLQIELVDHLASCIEERMKCDPSISFEKALQVTYEDFGIFGFAKIVDEKLDHLNKFWRRKVIAHFLSFFSIPKIVFTIFLFLFLLFIMQEGIILPSVIVVSSWILSTCALIWVYFYYKKIGKEGRKYLFVQTNLGITVGIIFSFFYLPNIWYAEFAWDAWIKNLPAQLIISGSITVGIILLYICIKILPVQLEKEMKARIKNLS